MAKIAVTGGAGFIGSHLVEALVKQKHDVVILDNFSTGKHKNLKVVRGQVKTIRGDICDLKAVRRALKGVSRVYHLAAISSVPLSVDQPLDTWENNLSGTWNVLEASRLAGAKRVVLISSASVYGASKKIPFKESMALKPSSPYAASKLIGEGLCELYLRLYGLETVAMRLFSVFGPRQNLQSQYSNVIPAFSGCLIGGKRPTIYGKGQQTRDFIFVRDVARALVKAGTARDAVGEVINFGSGKQTSILMLLQAIQQIVGTNVKAQFKPLKPGDDPRTCADISKAKKLLKIGKLTDFEVALKETVNWFDKNYRK